MTMQQFQPPSPFDVVIGEIGVNREWVVTPAGSVPVKGSRWSVVDRVTVTRAIPTWAVVCAILGAVFCLLGLLFLLAREDQFQGTIDVTVDADRLTYTTQIYPTAGVQTVYLVRQQVWTAQQLAV